LVLILGTTLRLWQARRARQAETERMHLRQAKSALETLPEIELSDFFMDRYEVSNRRFKESVDAGGYQKPEYWKHKFFRNGLELSWAEAMKLFVDHTGKPGPATWSNGDFPVGGVSWYEAAAYAEWAGLRLPTLYHWKLAAGDTEHR
jgi:eukaryotic-like serine/threonine-protein kinase